MASVQEKLADSLSVLKAYQDTHENIIIQGMKTLGETHTKRLIQNGYLEQESITALKRRKRDKKMVETDIKAKIRRFEVRALGENTVLDMELDSGSVSNCSPELVISSFCSYAGIDTPRYDMEVERMSLKFYNNLQF